jgi:predicted MFS family arabinose efflux permease
VPEKSLWSKSFILIMAVNCLMGLTYYIQMTTLASYATQTYQTSASLAGFAASIFILGSTFGRLIAGKYLDIIGRRRLCYGGFALFFLGSLAYFAAPNIGSLLLVRILHGILFGAANTAIATIVLDFIAQNRRGEGIGYYSLSATCAVAVGPFIGVLLTQNFSYSAIFWVTSGFSLLMLLILPFIHIQDHPAPQQVSKGLHIRDYYEPNALSIALVMMLICMCYSCVTTFISSYALELNVAYIVSAFFLVYASVMFVARPYFGRLLDRRGDNIVVIPVILSMALGLAMLAIANGAWLILFAAVPLSIGFGTLMSCGQAIAVKSSTPEKASLATSTALISSELGLGLGTVLMGLFVDYSSYAGMYAIAAAITLALTALYWLVHGRHVQAKQLISVKSN